MDLIRQSCDFEMGTVYIVSRVYWLPCGHNYTFRCIALIMFTQSAAQSWYIDVIYRFFWYTISLTSDSTSSLFADVCLFTLASVRLLYVIYRYSISFGFYGAISCASHRRVWLRNFHLFLYTNIDLTIWKNQTNSNCTNKLCASHVTLRNLMTAHARILKILIKRIQFCSEI